ncbi:MAG: HTH-type transcriptional regulator HdfR [Tolumonas sp.]|uniref:Transcriptional regulator, LysR family n=1 Tax=Tolumonas auensis (strain DSM 9187 / NBRC 110442 / TA 4) TaxID=595494 RepID=C4L893_TOLAT|nr:HTH-type transcriptional regulator HdfR [Tolumonas auensis]ACQ93739.1 transcriptional regulator, LysR family [Tolumonas auensis DSM 9187]MBP7981176.1 HTH-type transcriptional regulator HdfR [Tolumonas sp.]
MDTDLLRTFIEVSKTRHFGRAAENLYLTQSAVSFRIRQLEQQLGVSLFARHRNNIQLTLSGEHLLPYAETILQTLGRAKQALIRDDAMQHQLVIGAPQVCWEMGLQQWLDGWFSEQQNQAMRLETGNREQLCRQLLERSLDLAVITEPSKIDEVSVQQVGEFQLCLVSRTSGLNTSMLTEQAVIWPDWNTNMGSATVPAELLQRMPTLQTSSAQQALHHLLKHGGVAYLPQHLIASHLKNGELHFVEGVQVLLRPVYLAYRTGSEQQPHIESLLNRPLRLSTLSA